MKKSFAARRVPRKIGGDEDEEDGSAGSSGQEAGRVSESPIVRPKLGNKPKKSSALRMSFGPTAASTDDDDSTEIFKPRKSNLSRLAAERNAAKRLPSDRLPIRIIESDDERPTYSEDYLSELKNSTPSTPKASKTSSAHTSDGEAAALDVAAKFGAGYSNYIDASSAIPTEAEIREKKERRRRLAKEQGAEDFVGLDDRVEGSDGSDNGRGDLILEAREVREKGKYAETRLVREDEDILEDFDDFVEDGKISLGKKAEREQAKKRKQEMAYMINDAEGGDSDASSNDSEAARKEAYEAAQTRHGTYGSRDSQKVQSDQRSQTPPRITPLPTLDGVLDKLKSTLSQMRTARMVKVKNMEALQREKVQIAEEEVRIQQMLKETGERYQRLRMEAGGAGDEAAGQVESVGNGNGGGLGLSAGMAQLGSGRGLESFGSTPVAMRSDASDTD
ncbi:hypothetical protein LTR04_000592 [Oleoguttula sp. CCFEE 6159]|nr:hypothetical protein LTR04_000592 [Oleoguttula sp. CCFEE 6159]